jgi:hypothetical protein
MFLLLSGAGLLAMAGLYALIRTGSPAVAIRTPAVIFIIAVAWSAGFLRELLLPGKKAGRP